ncbi:hypothetical protein PsYK624_106720 [Phanerochaete sordida]|uniref:Uncharacterized protein n=1 Tax=Phanerochaete sordida TaxID=48140 RepID=A0A9P3GGI1_9APHY|nr:hypothetical protein PsYK624_106720 [Phanerochaete sordida]
MRHRLAAASCWLLAAAGGIYAQSASVNCSADFAWASNNLGQNVCEITAYLRAACTADPAGFDLGPPQSGHYGPPVTPDRCTCSMAYYNAASACSLCQGKQVLSWSASIKTCPASDITVSGYGQPIPSGTDIPAWAFLNVTSLDTFDTDTARTFSTTNSTMFGGASSSSSSSVIISFPTLSLSPASSGSASATPSAASNGQNKSNAGAIAGGVIGGLAGAAALASAAVFWWRRRIRAPRAAETAVDLTSPWTFTGAAFGKPYDPDDPSTFPDALHPPTMAYVQSQSATNVTSPSIASAPPEYTHYAEV